MHEYLESFTNSLGKPARLFIEPTGEFWQTEGDSYYGGRFFRKHDYLAAGCEFVIQGYSIYTTWRLGGAGAKHWEDVSNDLFRTV